MKIVITFLLLTLILGCRINSEQESTKKISNKNSKTKIAFSSRTIDFGTLPNDTSVKAHFYIKNIGFTKLIIKEISPECNCIKYKLDNDYVLPGDSTRLLVFFSTHGQGEGLIRKAIILESNNEKEYSTLFIKCIILSK